MSEPHASLDTPSGAERSEVLALVAEKVRLRFALDAATFADRLLLLARVACPGSDSLLRDHVRRLSLDDLYLASACSLDDPRAWEELAGRYLGFIRVFARRFLREPDAMDLADQVLADLWQRRKIARYEGRSTLRTWLGAVVAHAALNAATAGHRAAASLDREQPLEARLAGPLSAEPAANEARSLLGRLVAEAIGGLPPGEKLLLYLYYEQDLTLDQMAVALRASKAALSRRLTRTRSSLRAAIESLARSVGASADGLRAGIDLRRLELDLSDLLGRDWNESEPALSKYGERIRLDHDESRACY